MTSTRLIYTSKALFNFSNPFWCFFSPFFRNSKPSEAVFSGAKKRNEKTFMGYDISEQDPLA